ncbi:MAG TPA: FAD-dependent tricarballylate dehydrogenase TcuA [Pseudonocardia sp.]|jgi:tricarballylate dehydrogenase|uniref:FAD-dependent tricarballylate dehydrogenase TcuA n=1 Tax=Pseudonocardia sp. TaxID=60912 RepID=UPI002B4B7F00|nr:FAD-dependent tricarballylate dehydrogenase TcuA [Pseudonocardia sp.]HLU56055.1 FAD-dependent tricarballylate dehydrogenase TcuA [Pseudonocardia sp.]
MTRTDAADVVVVGGGNAGFSAAHAAAERGRRVVLLERGTADTAGGNSYYTAGATRIAHGGLDDLRDLVDPDERHARTEVPPYPEEEYLADLVKVTEGRTDRAMAEVLVRESHAAVRWLHGLGLRYRLMYERQAYRRPDGSYLFWGGLHVGNTGGGEGLIADHTAVAARLGTEVRYGARATGLLTDGGRITGVRYETADGEHEITADSVVLAAGGFEANPRWRREYLGEGWDRAVVRGTPHNQGDMIAAALELGAARGGDWSTCHSVQWDAAYPDNESNRELTNRLTRQSYPLGIIVNAEGRRFLDEGADFRNYTYAKYGREILRQPGAIAHQVFDATLRPLLRPEEYDMPGIAPVVADTLEDLADGMGVDRDAFVKTVAEFNGSIATDRAFDPTVKDGRAARVDPPKSNWAVAIETPPFYAYAVTCGITFTFGGLKGDLDGRVLDRSGRPIPGLFACGEMLAGLFSGNYPGGAGLAAGCVFGRRVGRAA